MWTIARNWFIFLCLVLFFSGVTWDLLARIIPMGWVMGPPSNERKIEDDKAEK